ncbi:hypothetical protein NDU88_012645 [Pleurodeles waltl]|uniref:Uncharacterized protein n=1 Tax=Pleurodeles waltl TaxID=8319 RepID=A0AAV7R6E4_PLEWA|nr:hypothetical protein NDU88_012645 [Pleurodeles waltl]
MTTVSGRNKVPLRVCLPVLLDASRSRCPEEGSQRLRVWRCACPRTTERDPTPLVAVLPEVLFKEDLFLTTPPTLYNSDGVVVAFTQMCTSSRSDELGTPIIANALLS